MRQSVGWTPKTLMESRSRGADGNLMHGIFGPGKRIELFSHQSYNNLLTKATYKGLYLTPVSLQPPSNQASEIKISQMRDDKLKQNSDYISNVTHGS